MKDVYLTILIPAYNEAKRLPESIVKINDYCRANIKQYYEILVVDDGSIDGTATLVQEQQSQIPALVLHRYEQNRGKGFALRKGMDLAAGRYVLFTDSDLSTPIEEIDRFLRKLEEGARIVIATRKHTNANILKHQPLWRESMGKTFTWLSNTILGLEVSDFTCGFKAFEASAGKHIFSIQLIDRWAFDSEVLFLAKRSGFEIHEIPVQWIDSPESRVRAFRDTFTSLAALFQIRLNWSGGKYVGKANESGRIPADV